MKKKLFSVLLVAALATSLLAGCGNKKAEETTSTTQVTEVTEVAEEKTVSADGIKITGSMGTAEKVEMSAVTDGDDYKAATDYIATLEKNITATEVYNINLLDKNSKKVQPDSSVKINLTLSDNMVNAEGDGYEVYRMEDDKTFTKLTASVKDKEISFNTEHFSIYVVVKTNSAIADTEATEVQAEETSQSPYSFTDMTATMYAQSAVNVRDLPDASGNKVGGLSTNQEVIVSGKCNETGWYRIEYNEGDAYVSDKYLGDSKVETAKNTSSSSSSQSSTGTSSTNNDSQPAASSDSGSSNTGSTASKELPSNPYQLNTVVEDTGSSVSFYCLETFTNGVSNGYPNFYDTAHQATEYIMNMGKTPGDVVSNGTVGEYKEGIVWKWTRYYN